MTAKLSMPAAKQLSTNAGLRPPYDAEAPSGSISTASAEISSPLQQVSQAPERSVPPADLASAWAVMPHLEPRNGKGVLFAADQSVVTESSPEAR